MASLLFTHRRNAPAQNLFALRSRRVCSAAATPTTRAARSSSAIAGHNEKGGQRMAALLCYPVFAGYSPAPGCPSRSHSPSWQQWPVRPFPTGQSFSNLRNDLLIGQLEFANDYLPAQSLPALSFPIGTTPRYGPAAAKTPEIVDWRHRIALQSAHRFGPASHWGNSVSLFGGVFVASAVQHCHRLLQST